MGSGATKVSSHENSVTKVDQDVNSCSEDNNNVPIKKSKRVTGTSAIQRPTSETFHSVEAQKSKQEPHSQLSKIKDVPSRTEVLSLKPRVLEPIRRESEKSSVVIKQLNKELADSESKKQDLQDQIQLLEDKVSLSGALQQHGNSNSPDSLKETLHAKDQYILKLERETKTNQADSTKLRIKLKKRIKSLTNQLYESRQEASISQMELKSEVTRQAEEIKSLKVGLLPSLNPSQQGVQSPDQDHSKIIVELSNQLSEQAEQITCLEAELSEKKKEISDLKVALSNHFDTKDAPSEHKAEPTASSLPHTSTDRLHSSRGKRVTKNSEQLSETNLQTNSNRNDFNTTPTPMDGFAMERQSTALSDSDSDWEAGSPVPSHTHSAPARSRIKSAMSIARSEKHRGSLTTLNGNDDSLLDLVKASPIDQSREQRVDGYKMSTLKNHLEKTRKENQMNSLIGPSLAFEKRTEQFSDTSCEPTPRPKKTTFHPDSKIRIVKPLVH